MTDIRSDTAVRAFVDDRASRSSVPATVTTDRDHQFQSNFFRNLMALLKVSRIHTTACHVISNGIVERFRRLQKTSLCAQYDAPN